MCELTTDSTDDRIDVEAILQRVADGRADAIDAECLRRMLSEYAGAACAERYFLSAAVTGWITVGDDPPDLYVDVLVTLPADELGEARVEMAAIVNGPDGPRWALTGEITERQAIAPIAWMPRPEPWQP